MIRNSKRRSFKLKGGGGLSQLNSSPLEKQSDPNTIALTNPSPLLARSQPYIPPRPGAPSPPPPLGPTSGPAFGLKIGPPPLLSFSGSKGGGCGCMSKGGRRKKKSKSRRKKGGGNFNLPNPFGKLSFDANPFNNKSDSSTGKVSSEQAQADKNHGAFSSSEHTSQLHANTVLGKGGKRRKSKRRHRKMRGGGDFFKNLFNMGQKNTDSSENESKHSEKHSDKTKTNHEEKHESKNAKDVVLKPFKNLSDASTGQVDNEQAAADKRQGAESSGSHTQKLDFKTLWENAFEHGKISGGKRKKSKNFKKKGKGNKSRKI